MVLEVVNAHELPGDVHLSEPMFSVALPRVKLAPRFADLHWHRACSGGLFEEEHGMFRSLQILCGMVIGCIGFTQIGENPVQGSTALLVGGFLVLSGVDRFFEIQNK